MDKKILDTIADESMRLLVSKIIDMANLALRHQEARFSQFLDPASAMLIRTRLHFTDHVNVRFWGGYDDAERQMLCISPDWMQAWPADFPICLLELTGRFDGALSHRDCLGALMALGITRESVGDIVAGADKVSVFVRNDLAPFIKLNLTRVGRYGVTVCEADTASFTAPGKKSEMLGVFVASMRLDAVLAAALHLSRSAASMLVSSGKVNVNHLLCSNLSHVLCAGDLISVRGFGRLEVGEIGGMSRKGKTFVHIRKYL